MAKDIYMYVLGAILVLGFLCLLGILIFQGIPPSNSDILYLAVGALISQAGNVVNYFFIIDILKELKSPFTFRIKT